MSRKPGARQSETPGDWFWPVESEARSKRNRTCLASPDGLKSVTQNRRVLIQQSQRWSTPPRNHPPNPPQRKVERLHVAKARRPTGGEGTKPRAPDASTCVPPARSKPVSDLRRVVSASSGGRGCPHRWHPSECARHCPSHPPRGCPCCAGSPRLPRVSHSFSTTGTPPPGRSFSWVAVNERWIYHGPHGSG